MKISKYIIVFLFLFFFSSVYAGSQNLAGLWRTYDLQGHPRSIIRMYERNGQFQASIVKILDRTPNICSACKKPNKNKPLVGMTIIRGLKAEGGQWVNGKVLDVDSGKYYECKVQLSENGQVMHFSAFVMTSMFGKTVDWYRVK